jgi:hypothetical protein
MKIRARPASAPSFGSGMIDMEGQDRPRDARRGRLAKGQKMGFLIRSAFWLSLALLLIPVDTGETGHGAHISAFQALVAAGEAASDVAGMCERKPEVCTIGRSALETIGARARVSAKYAYEMLDEHFSDGDRPATAVASTNTDPTIKTGTVIRKD